MRRLRDLSIGAKLTGLTVLSAAVGLVLAAAVLIGYGWFTTRAGAERDLRTLARILADNSTAALVFGDRGAVSETLGALRAKSEITLACLYGTRGGGPFGFYDSGGSRRCPAAPEAPGVFGDSAGLNIVTPVELRGERVGTLRLTQSDAPLRAALLAQVVITVTVMMVSFAASLAIGWILQRMISRPIVALAETARRVSRTRDYGLRAAAAGDDEVGRLVEDFNHMLVQIAGREREIREARDALAEQVREKTLANADLERTLARLSETQEQLVQSEKLASLGALVAGVAHEINTPIGVGVTAASTLQAKAAQIRGSYEKDKLKRSDLERFIQIADESTRIILNNLRRAADLIHSFKQVAVDQSSGERRQFALKGYIEEVLLSLGPRLRKSGHEVVVDCPESLTADSHPGALAQILANLVGNSLMHAFEPGVHGHIRIGVREAGGPIELRYADDGVGIPPENLPRVFDPFFTTKRGAGGSGLGLHIVYNLVTQVLGGTITLDSAPGRGTVVTVRFPGRAQEIAA